MDKYKEYKDSGIEWIGWIPTHWEVKNIKNIIEKIKTGRTPSTSNDLYFNDGTINWFRPNDISKNFVLDSSSKKITMKALLDDEVTFLKKDAVLVNTIGAGLGNVSYVISEHATNQQITHLKFKEINKYYSYLLLSLKDFIYCLANTTTLPQLNNDRFKYLYLIKPKLEEQTAIANFLDEKTGTIDSAVEELIKQRNLLKELKEATINELLTKGLKSGNNFYHWVDFKNRDKTIKKNNRIFKKEIIEIKKKYDKPINDIKNNIKILKEYKKVLINDVVTGKIKVYKD